MDLAGELVVVSLVVFGNRRGIIFAYVSRLVSGEDDRLRAIDAPLTDLFVVHVDGSQAPFAETSAVIREVEADRRRAGGDGL